MTTLHSFLNSYLFPVKAIAVGAFMSANPKMVLYKYLYSEGVKGVKPLHFQSEFLFFYAENTDPLCEKCEDSCA